MRSTKTCILYLKSKLCTLKFSAFQDTGWRSGSSLCGWLSCQRSWMNMDRFSHCNLRLLECSEHRSIPGLCDCFLEVFLEFSESHLEETVVVLQVHLVMCWVDKRTFLMMMENQMDKHCTKRPVFPEKRTLLGYRIIHHNHHHHHSPPHLLPQFKDHILHITSPSSLSFYFYKTRLWFISCIPSFKLLTYFYDRKS